MTTSSHQGHSHYYHYHNHNLDSGDHQHQHHHNHHNQTTQSTTTTQRKSSKVQRYKLQQQKKQRQQQQHHLRSDNAAVLAETSTSYDTNNTSTSSSRGYSSHLNDNFFRFLKPIGQGTVGTAYKAVRLDDRATVCVKKVDVSNLTQEERKRALSEASILASLSSPYVVKYYGAYLAHPATVSIVMEYVPHGTLLDRIRNQRGRRLSERAVWRYFLQVASGLDHIHSCGVLHRDLKSTNVLIGANDDCRIVDLGSAAVLKARGQLAATTVGTPYYLAPELCRNEPYGEKADVWALGCILYELLCLRYPFRAGNQAALVMKIIEGKFEAPSSAYSTELVNIVYDLLSLDPNSRPSAGAIIRRPSVAVKCAQMGVVVPTTAPGAPAHRSTSTNLTTSGPPPPMPKRVPPMLGISIDVPAGRTPTPNHKRGGVVRRVPSLGRVAPTVEVTGSAVRTPMAQMEMVRKRTSTGQGRAAPDMAHSLYEDELSPNRMRIENSRRQQMQWTDTNGIVDTFRRISSHDNLVSQQKQRKHKPPAGSTPEPGMISKLDAPRRRYDAGTPPLPPSQHEHHHHHHHHHEQEQPERYGMGTPPQQSEREAVRMSREDAEDGIVSGDVLVRDTRFVEHEVFSPSNLRLLPSWWRAHATGRGPSPLGDTDPMYGTLGDDGAALMEPIASEKFAGLIDPLALPRSTSTPPETWNSPFLPHSPRKRRLEGIVVDSSPRRRTPIPEHGGTSPIPPLGMDGASGAAAKARRAIESPRFSWAGGGVSEMRQLVPRNPAIERSRSDGVKASMPGIPKPPHERAGRLVPIPSHHHLMDHPAALRAKSDSPIPLGPVLHRSLQKQMSEVGGGGGGYGGGGGSGGAAAFHRPAAAKQLSKLFEASGSGHN